MLEFVVETAITILAAATGALFGAFFAISKIRRETAFARRLRWCEEAMKSFNVAGAALVSAQRSVHGTEVSEACWTQAIKCYEKLIPLCGQKEIYASSAAVIAINGFMSAFYDLIMAHLESHSGQEQRDRCGYCIERLQDAGMVLAQEARSHLGLQSLPDGIIKAEYKFVGSVKGEVLYGHEKSS